MKAITGAQWDEMPWHQRQQYLIEQNQRMRQLDALIAEREALLDGLVDEATTHGPDHLTESRRVGFLASEIQRRMTPDPNAAQHRADLLDALTTRKAAA